MLALAVLVAAFVAAPAVAQVGVRAVNGVAFEGQEAVFEVFLLGGAVPASNRAVAVTYQWVPLGGLTLAELDVASAAGAVSIQSGQNSAEVRVRVKQDSIAESGEVLFLLPSEAREFGTGLPAAGRVVGITNDPSLFRGRINIRDTYRVTLTGPGSAVDEDESAVFTVRIGDGLVRHPILAVDFDIPDIDGFRYPEDHQPPTTHHDASGASTGLQAAQRAAPPGAGAGSFWRGAVLSRIRDDRGPAQFTITIATRNDVEPESDPELLCVQLRAMGGGPGVALPYRLQIATTSRVCVNLNDNELSLWASFGENGATDVREGAQVFFPVRFSDRTLGREIFFSTAGSVHPGVVTYIHYFLRGSATAGADYTVQPTPNGFFDAATRRGYLRVRPGVPTGDAGAAPHRLTINVLSDALAEGDETVIAILDHHGHNANRNDRDQGDIPGVNPSLRTARNTIANGPRFTIARNAPVQVAVSTLPPVSVTEGGIATFQVCAVPGANLRRDRNTRVTYRIDGGGDRFFTGADFDATTVAHIINSTRTMVGYNAATGGVVEIPATANNDCAARIAVETRADGNPFELAEQVRVTLTGASGGGGGGAQIVNFSAFSSATIQQSSAIVYIGAGGGWNTDCLRKSPADPACTISARARDFTIEGRTWSVPVGVVAPAGAGGVTIRYDLSGNTHTAGDGTATVLFDTSDFTDPNNGVLNISADNLQNGGAINIRMLNNADTVFLDAAGDRIDEIATINIRSVAWQDAAARAPIAVSDDWKTASTRLADDEITVRLESCSLATGAPVCDGLTDAVYAEGALPGAAIFELTFYDAAGVKIGSRNNPLPNGVVRYRIGGDVAAADYGDPFNGAATVAAQFGNERRFSVTIIDDNIAENDEELTVTLTSVEGGVHHIDADHNSASVTIPANDGLRVYPRLVHAPAQVEPGSGSTRVQFEFCTAGEAITSDASDDLSLVVNYEFRGTATGASSATAPGADYRRDNPPGEISQRAISMRGIRQRPLQTPPQPGHRCIAIPSHFTGRNIDILADTRNEPAETISVAITSVSQFGAGAKTAPVSVQTDTTPVTYTVAASDPLTVTITACPATGACAADSAAATEFEENTEGGAVARFLVSYNGDTVPGAQLAVSYRISGDVSRADYTPPSTVFVSPSGGHSGVFGIAAGAATAAQRTISIGIADDTVVENAEDLVVDFTEVVGGPGSGAISFTPVQFSATIPANDGFQGTVTAVQSRVAEGQAAVFEFTLIGQLELVGIYRDTYTTGGTWEGAAADDADEPFAYSIDCRALIDADDDPDTPPTANPDSDIGADGICRIQFSIDIPTDAIVEDDETLTITLATGSAPAATVTITDNTPVTVVVTASPDSATVAEGGSALFLLNFNLAPGVNLPAAVTAAYTYAGDAVTDGGGSATVIAGGNLGSFEVDIPDDNLNEPASTLTVTLGEVTGGSVAGDATASATVTVAASDPIAVSITAPATADEADSVTYTVALSGGVRTAAVVMPFSLGSGEGRRLSNAEYTITAPPGIAADATVGTVTFLAPNPDATPPVVATATDTFAISVNLLGDTVNEASENLTIIGAPAGAMGLRIDAGVDDDNNRLPTGDIEYTDGGNLANVQITDDDALTVTVTPAEAAVAEGGEAVFTVALSTTSAADVEVAFAAAIVTQSMTANAAANPDFTLTAPAVSPLTISAGATDGTITLAIADDRLEEAAETLRLSVTGATVGAAGGAVATTFPVTSEVTIGANAAAVYRADFADAATEIAEGATETFTVVLAGAREFSGDIQVAWGFTAGETAAADFTAGTAPAGGVLTFTHAGRTQTFTVNIADDDLAEGGNDGDETFGLTLAAASALDDARLRALGGVAFGESHSVAITDADDLRVAIARKAGETGPIGEDGGTATFTVSLTGATSTADVTVDVAVSTDSAGAGDTSAPSSLTIPAGVASAEIEVLGVADDLLEGTETFTVTIGGPAGGGGVVPVIDTATSAAVAITDAETPTVTIARLDADGFTENAAGAAGTAVFTVTLSGGELVENAAVVFTVDGGTPPGTTGNDYTVAPAAAAGVYTLSVAPVAGMQTATATITLTQVDDAFNEAAETVAVELTGASGSGLTDAAIDDAADSASAELADDDAIEVAIARVGDSPLAEAAAGTVEFSVTLSGGIRLAEITVPFSVGGAGVDADDFDIDGPGTAPLATATMHTVTFPAPSDSVTPLAGDSMRIAIAIEDDGLNEADEALTVTGAAAGASGLRIGDGGGAIAYADSANAAQVQLTDDDAAVYSIADADAVMEGSGGTATVTMQFTVTLSPASAGTVTIPFALTGSATGGADYTTPSPLSVTINAGATTATIAIDISRDTVNEANENIIVTLAESTATGFSKTARAGTVTRAAELTNYRATGTINDDDGASVTITGGGDVDEGDDATVTVMLSATASGMVTVNYTLGVTAVTTDNDAEIAEDLTDTSGGSITIDTSTTRSGAITIGVDDDDLNEGDETFEVRVSMTGTDLPGFVSVTGGVQTFTIKDDSADAIAVAIERMSSAMVDEGDSATFTVSLSGGARTADVVVPFSFSGLDDAEFDISTPTGFAMNASGGELTFTAATAATVTSMQIGVDLIGDAVNEPTETLTVTGAAAGATGLRTAGAIAYRVDDSGDTVGNRAQVSITDDDALIFTLSRVLPQDQRRDVDEGGQAQYRVRMDAAAADGNADFNKDVFIGANPVTVAWRVINSAASDDVEAAAADFDQNNDNAADAALPSGELTFPANTETRRADAIQNFILRIFDDNLQEPAEAFAVEIDAPTGTHLGRATVDPRNSPHDDVTIAAGDATFVTIARASGAPASVAENATGVSFTVALSGGVRSGTVTVPVNFSGLDNAEYDITAPTGDYDDDPTTPDTAPPAGDTGVTIVFGVDGAIATDSVTVTVDLQGDSLNEATETLTLTGAAKGTTGLRISAGDINYADNGNAASVQVTDDDAATYSIADASAVTEVDPGGTNPTMRFTVSLSALSAGAVTIPYTVDTTGSSGVDFTAPSGSVTIAAGSMSADIDITILADNENEGAETITVTLAAETDGSFSKTAAAGAVTLSTAAGANTASGTINDDDGATVTLTGGGDVDEGDDAEVTVTLSAEASGSVTVMYSIGATAVTTDVDAQAADYDDSTDSGSITIDTSTSRTGTITIGAVDDDLNEATETFTVAITNMQTDLPGGVTVSGSPQTFNIIDGDAISVTAARASGQAAQVDEADNTDITFTVTATGGVLSGDLSVAFSITGAGITADDYDITAPLIDHDDDSATPLQAPAASATGGTLIISPGSASDADGNAATAAGTVTVRVANDALNEDNEPLELTLGAVSTTGDATVGDGPAPSVQINRNDPVTVTIARTTPAGAGNVDEGQAVTFTVTLSGASQGAVQVPWSAAIRSQANTGDAANANTVDNSDVTASGATPTAAGGTVAGTATIAAGATQATFTVTVAADGLAEAAETMRASISSPTGDALAGMVTTGTTTHVDVGINANQAQLHFVTVTTPAAAITEGGNATFTFALGALTGANARTTDLTVAYTLGGNAVGGASTVTTRDYTNPSPLTVTFTPTETSKTVIIATNDDDLNEAAESIRVTLGAITNAASFAIIGGAGVSSTPAVATIAANDPVTYSIADATAVTEVDAGGTNPTLSFTVSLSAASAGAVTIPFTLNNGAGLTAADYTTPSPLSVTIAAGATSETIDITVLADDINEGAETLTVTLAAETDGSFSKGAAAGAVTLSMATGANTASGAINDDDAATVTLSGGGNVTEGNDAEVTVTLSAEATGSVTVMYSIAATAATTDVDAESADYTNTSGGSITIDTSSTRTGTITIGAVDDNLNEATETFTVAVAAAQVNLPGGVTVTGGTQTFSIIDNDAIAVTIARAGQNPPSHVDEDAGAVDFTVSLAGGVRTTAVTVPFTISGMNITAGDYVAASTTVTFPAPNPDATPPVVPSATDSATVTVTITDDNLNEAAETLTIIGAAASATGLRVGSGGGAISYASTTNSDRASVTINANDATTVRLARAAGTTASVGEDSAASFTVTLGGGVRGGAVTVPVSFSGLDNAEFDITAPTGDYDDDPMTADSAPATSATGVTLVFPGPSSTVTPTATDAITVTVNLHGDSINEATETLRLTGAAAGTSGLRIAGVGAVRYAMRSASVQVTDDDDATYSIADASPVTEVDAGGTNPTMQFSVTLSRASAAAVTIPYTLGGSATGGGVDYTDPTQMTVTIAAGQTTNTIDIDLVHDNLNEAAETLEVTLGDMPTLASGAGTVTRATSMDDYTATGTINDDDAITVTLSTTSADVNEGADATVNIAITGATTTATATITYAIGLTAATTDNDAEPAHDLTDTSGGIVAIAPGMTSARITIGVDDDDLNEGDETFTVTVNAAGIDTAGAVSTVTGGTQTFTIKDDANDATTVSIARAAGTAASVAEDGGASFTVTLGGGVRTGVVTVPVVFSGLDADAPNEYDITMPLGDYDGDDMTPDSAPAATAADVTIVFGIDGSETASDSETVTVNLIDDNTNEATETLTLTGADAGATGLRIGAGRIRYAAQSANVMVTDTDARTVSIAAAQNTDVDTTVDGIQVDEGSGVTLTVTLSGASAGAATVAFSLDAIASANSGDDNDDMTPDVTVTTPSSGNTVTIDKGATAANIVLGIAADRLAEGDETLTVRLGSVSFDDDGGALTVATGTAQLIIRANAAAAHAIAFDSPAASIAEGATATTYTIRRMGPAIPSGATIDVAWAFTNGAGLEATSAADFSGGLPAGATVQFTGSESTKTFTIAAAQDALAEGGADGHESFALALSEAATLTEAVKSAVGGVSVATTQYTVTLTDTDDLQAAIARKAGETGPIAEDGGTATFTISLTGATSIADVTVDVAVGGIDAADYSAPGSLTIVAGESSGDITVTSAADALVEGAESFTVTISNARGGGGALPNITTAASLAVTITDAESATITIARSDTDGFTEDASGAAATAVFTVTIAGAQLAEAVDVTFTVAGGTEPGMSGADYAVSPAASAGVYTLTVNPVADANSASADITVTALTDELNEATETVTVTLTNASGSGLTSAAGSATADLADDDAISVSIARHNTAASVVESASATFRVTLTGGTRTADVVMPFSFSGDVSNAEFDITAPLVDHDNDQATPAQAPAATALSGALVFPASTASTVTMLDITVDLNGDSINEAAETLTVTGAANDHATNALRTAGAIDYAGDGRASVTVTDDDDLTFTLARTTAAGEVAEGTAMTFTVTMTGGSVGGNAITLPWSVGATAADGDAEAAVADFDQDNDDVADTGNLPAGNLTFPANTAPGATAAAQTFSVRIFDDAAREDEEAFAVSLGAPTATGLGATDNAASPHDVTIAASDQNRQFTLACPATVAEAASGDGLQCTVTYTSTDSGGYALPAAANLTWAVDPDGASAAVAGARASGADFAGAADAQGEFTGQVPVFALGTTGVENGGAGAVRNFTIPRAVADSLSESAESFRVHLRGTPPAGAALGAATDDVTIAASDPLTVSIAGASIAEPADGDGDRSAHLAVTFAPATARPPGQVSLTFTATAGPGATADDYTLGVASPAAVTVAGLTYDCDADANTPDAYCGVYRLPVTVKDDALNEAAETVTIRLDAITAAGANIAFADADNTHASRNGVLTIPANDARTVTIAPAANTDVDAETAGVQVDEGGSVTLTVTLDGESAGTATVAFAITPMPFSMSPMDGDNTAANPDYTVTTPAAGNTVTIAAGQTTADIVLSIDTDQLAEADETLTVTLGAVSFSAAGDAVTVGDPSSAELIVRANAAAVFAVDFVAAAPAVIAEGGSATFAVELTGGVFAGNIEVLWEFFASETAPADFAAGAPAGGTLTFTHANRRATFTVTAAQDAHAEGGADGDEVFGLILSPAATLDAARRRALGGVALGMPHAVAITDADDIVVSIARAGSGNIAEDGGSATFNVRTTFTPSAALTVPFTVSATSAGADDYTVSPATGRLVIAANQAGGATITVTAVDDDLLEGDETFGVTLGAPSGGGGVAPVNHPTANAVAAVTIADAEAPTIRIARSDGDGFTEDASGAAATAVFTVTIAGAQLSEAARITFTVAGGTPPGAGVTDNDYTVSPAASGDPATYSLRIAPGAADDADNDASTAAADITVTAASDDRNEPAETVTVTLTGASGSGLASASGSASAQLADDDAIAVTIARVGAATRAENAGDVEFTVTLGGGARTADITVPFTVGGTGITADDFDISGPGTAPAATAMTHTVTFPAPGPGVTITATDAMTITIAVEDDDLNEAAETLTVTGDAAGATGLRIGSGGGAIAYADGGNTAGVQLTDNDAIEISVARTAPAGAGAVAEGAPVTFTVSMDHASAGPVSVAWSAAMAMQMQEAGEGANTQSRPDLTATATTSATATRLDGVLQISPGGRSGTVVITAANDGFAERAESFGFLISRPMATGGAGAVAFGDDTFVSVTIAANAAAAHVVTVAGPDGPVSEGGSAVFTLELPAVAGANARGDGDDLTVAYTVTGGTAGSDYPASAATGSVTFAHDSTRETVNIGITDDALNEAAETITLTLGAITDAADFNAIGGAAAVGSAQAVIAASDPVTYSIADATAVTEGDAGDAAVSLSFTVSLSAASAGDVTIPLFISAGTAAAGNDYTTPATTVTIAAGDTTADIDIDLAFDDINEADESVTVTVRDETHAAFAKAATAGAVTRDETSGADSATGTIRDDDDISVAITAATATVNEAGTAVFTFALSGDSAQAVVVPFVLSGVADAPMDYADPAPLSVTIAADAPGNRNTLRIPILHDRLDATDANEAENESLIVTLSAPAQRGVGVASSPGNSATVTIVNVDAGVEIATALTVVEGDSATYTVRLMSDPGAGAQVTVTAAATDELLTLSVARLTFTGGAAGTWNTAQTVRVTAGMDADDADSTATITHAVAGYEASGVTSAPDVSVAITDADSVPTFAAAVIDAQSYVQNTQIAALQFPQATRGDGVVTYALASEAGVTVDALSPGLVFDADASPPQLSGTPTTPVAATRMVYTATDADGHAAALAFELTVAEASVIITPLLLTMEPGGSATYRVRLNAPPNAEVRVHGMSDSEVVSVAGALDTEFVFTAANWNQAQAVVVRAMEESPPGGENATIAHDVAGGNYDGVDADAVRVRVAARGSDAARLHAVILPEVTRQISGQRMAQVARRVGKLRTDRVGWAEDNAAAGGSFSAAAARAPTAPTVRLGGQTSWAGLAAQRMQAMAGGEDLGDIDWRAMLGDAGFEVAAGGRGISRALGFGGLDAGARGDALSPTVVWWGEGAHQAIGGKRDGVDWSGDISSVSIGVDGNLRWGGRHREDLYGGWLVAWSDARADYKTRDGGDDNGEVARGEYDLQLTSVHPYISRDALDGRLAVYLIGGYGLGHLEVTDASGERRADVTLWQAGVGGDGVLLRGDGGGELRIKGEAQLARATVARGRAVADGIGIAAADVDTHRIRLAVEGGHLHALSAGVSLQPTVALGVRYDGGDGQTGGGVELGGGARYRDAGRRLAAGAQARGVVSHSAGSDDWGLSGHFELEGGLDGQGWSLALRPAVGNAGDGAARARQMWQAGLAGGVGGAGSGDGGDGGDAAALQARLDIRAAYGLRAFTHTGLLTPFSAMTVTAHTHTYRLGLQWTHTPDINLNLTGKPNDGVMLKGEMKF